jgi:hypothetical protein
MFVRREQVGLLSTYETRQSLLRILKQTVSTKTQRTRQHHATEFLTSQMD